MAYEIFKNTNSKKKKKNDDDDIFLKVSEFARNSANSGSRSEETPASSKPYKSAVTGYTPTSYLRDYDRYSSDKQSSTPSNDFKATAPSVTVESATESMKHNEEDQNFFQRIGSGVKDYLDENLEGYSFAPSSAKDFAKGLGYNAERLMVSPLIGFTENIMDFAGSAFYGAGEQLTSGFGIAPNKVSEWMGNAAESYLQEDWQGNYEKSIQERYNPTKGDEFVTGLAQNVPNILISIATGKGVASALGKGAQIVDKAADALKAQKASKAAFGLMAAGGGANQAYDEGATVGQSLAYGTATGMLELITEELAGAIPEFGGGKLTQIASRFIDNPVINKMIDIGGEGVEEVIVEMASPFIKRAIYDSDAELATPEQIVESAIMGMVTAGLLQAGVQAPIAVSAARQASQQKGAAYNSDIDALISEGLQSDPNSASYKLASQLQAKLDNGETISNNEALRLAKANQKAINLEMKQASTAKATAEVAPVEADVEAPAQSRAQTIEARLTESGMDATQATAVAQSLDRILAGDTTVTNKDKGVLSVGNNIARQIFTEESGVTLPASNSSTRKAVSEYIAQTAMKQPVQQTAVETEAKPVENVMTAWQNQKAQEQTVSQLKDSGSPFAVTTNSAEATLRQAAQEAVRKSKGQDVVINQANMASLGSNGKIAYQKHIGNAKSVSGFSNAFQRYYDAGAIGVPFDQIKTAYDGAADRSVLYEAYSAGQNDASVRSEGKSITEKKTTPKAKNKAVKSKGRFYDNRTRDGVSVAEKDITALKQVARAFNVDIEVVDTIAGSEGRSIANGYYKGGKIVIAADSDNPMMTVLKHEITHHLQRVSPQKYKQFKDYVLKAYFDNSQESMNAEIQRRMTLASLNNMELTRSEAMDEIVADATESFLTDRDSIDALIRENRSLGQTILNAIRDVLHKVEAALKGVDLKGYSGFMNADQLRTAEKMWVEALAAASQNEIGIDSVTISESSAPVWSMKSMKFDLLDGKMQRDLVEHGILTVEETDHLMSEISKLIDDMSPFAHIVDMNEEYGRDNRPYAVYKPNSDPLYKVSLDFSTLCKKRLMTQFVMESLQTKLGKALSAKEQIAIRSKLEEYGKTNKQIQVACALCYVEARRLKAPDQINRFLDNRTEILTDYFGKKNKDYKKSVDDMAAKMKVDMGYEADTALKAMKSHEKKKINTAKQKMMKEYIPTAEEQKIIDRANAIENAEFLSQDGLTRLNLNEPVIYDAFVTHVRNATKSKALEGGVPYYYGDSKSVSDALINAMNAENGLRHQSWSDFEIVHLLDTIAAVIDLSVRKAKVQSYTKVPAFVHVNGKTGMMINLSLIPAGSNGMKDGKLDFSPVEGMDYNVAVELRDQYHKTSGTIAIGIDDTQINMLLDDPTIDYVIPYHTSGMNAQLRKMAGIAGWADYESYQSEKEIKGAKQGNCPDELWHKKPDFSEWFDTSKLDMSKSGVEIMREAANRYLQLCKERGLSPKFSNSKKHTDFSKHKDYWKLLIDRKMVDGDGNIIIQQEVRPDFDFAKIREVVQTEIDNYDPTLLDSLHDQIFEAWEKGEIKQREAELLADEKAKKKAKKKAAKVANGLMEQVVAPEEKKQFSLKDSDYMDAVNRGDTETAQRMVDEKAKKAGFNIKLHHGTASEPFYVFRQGREGIHFGTLAQATHRAEVSSKEHKFRTAEYSAEDIRNNPSKYPNSARKQILYEVVNVLPVNLTQEERGKATALLYGDAPISNKDFLYYLSKAERSGRKKWNLSNDVMQKTGKKRVVSAWVKAQHPVTIDADLGSWSPFKLASVLIDKINGKTSELYNYQSDSNDQFDPSAIKGIKLTEADLPALRELQNSSDFEEMAKFLQSKGVDSIRYLNTYEGTKDEYSYILLSPEQVKSADPVTYDDDGNVIPISKRFDAKEQDIRYQLKSADEMLEMSKQIAEAEHKAKAVTDAEVMSQAIKDIAKTDEEKAVVRNYQNAMKKLAAYEQELATYEATKAEHGKGRSIYADASGNVKKSGVKYSAAEKAEIQRKIELWKRNLRDIEQKEAFKKVLKREKAKMTERHAKEIAKLRSSYDARLADLRAKRDAKIEAQKQKMRDYKQHQRDSKAYKELKGKLETDVKWLQERLDHPTDAKHIPEDFRKGVAAFLKSLDFETKYTDRNEIKNGKPSQKVIRLRELNEAYQKILADQSSTMELDAVLLETLKQLEKVTENRRVADLDYQELSLVRDAIHYLKQNIVMSNKFFNDIIKESVSALGDKLISEQRSKKARKDRVGVVGAGDKLLNYDSVTPADKFHEYGGVMEKMYKEIRKGFNKHIENTRTTINYVHGLLEGKEDALKEWSGDNAKPTKFTISDGTTIELTPAQVMSLYCLMKRDQAVGHVLGSGIVPSNVVVKEAKRYGKLKLNVAKKITSQKASRCTIEDIQNIVRTLTEDQRKVADGIVKLFTTKCADWGNETSMKLYGYKKFTEANYFPIKSSDAYLNARFDDGGDPLIKNLGFTKNTVVNANNPVVVDDIFDVLTDHANKMSMYNALVVPLTDFSRVFNYKTKGVNKDGEVVIGDSVQKAMETSDGQLGVNYVKQFIKDVNKEANSLAAESFALQALSNYKKAKIAASSRVLVQQPTSITRAANMVDPKYLVEGLKQKANYEELFTYSEIAYWKSLGFYQTDVSRSMRDIILSNESKLDQYTMGVYGKADDFTWGHLWNAIKLEQADAHPDMDTTSSEFLDLVKERFEEVVDRTQVVDSVFHRSQIMRSKGAFAKMATAFMSESTKQYNLLRTELMDASKTKDKQKAARAVATYVANAIIVSAFAAIVDAIRDDEDEDEEGNKRTLVDKYLDAVLGNIKDNINPLNLVAYLKEISSLWSGYSVNRMDMASLSELIKTANKWTQGRYTAAYMAKETAEDIAELCGIPLKNAVREVTTIIGTVGDLVGGHYYADYMVSKTKYNISNPDNRSVFYKHYTDALAAGDQEAADLILTDMVVNGIPYDNIISKGYQEQKADAFSEARKLIADGKTAEAKSLIRKLAKEYDKKYTTLWKAVKNGDPSNTPEETYDYKDLQKAVRKGEDTELIEDYLIEYGGYSEEAMEEAIKMLTEKYK